jgi:hypothetical protein
VVSFLAIPDDGFRAAFQRVVDAEGKLKSQYTQQEIGEIIMAMRLAQVDLNRAAERYMFSAKVG